MNYSPRVPVGCFLEYCRANNLARVYTMTFREQGENVPRVDAMIQDHFGGLMLRAEAGELTETWSKHPRSLVALILVLDQFSR